MSHTGRSSAALRDRVGQLLAERSMSQRQLAREVGITQGWLSHALKGERPLSVEILERIATVLEVEPAEFVEYRRAFVIRAMEDDPALVDAFFEHVKRNARGGRRSS